VCRVYPALDPVQLRYYPAEDVIDLILYLKSSGKKAKKHKKYGKNAVVKRVSADNF